MALGESIAFAAIPETLFTAPAVPASRPLLAGCRIAIGRDRAFSFLYPANLDTFRQLGADPLFFSPLEDTALPECDAVWLSGGYPELHAAKWSANTVMRAALQRHHALGNPLLAEYGGMMSLPDALIDRDGHPHTMAGLLRGRTLMQARVQALGLQAVDTADDELRGHSFHFSKLETDLQSTLRGRNPNGGTTAEAVYRERALTASYIHFYFASNPAATARLFAP